ncbi:MAG: dihydropteroate synthase, partial [Bacteroidota bacterium]|nr:dihydropteroate synthase [Bacteroidota bacterium]
MTEISSPSVFTIGGKQFDFSRRTFIMGILNVTPDSFSDGGKYLDPERAVGHALQMVEDGADIVDVGGQSTRPKGVYGEGADMVSAEEEMRRVVPVIEQVARKSDVPISIDTYKSNVATAALNAGAVIVNDISGLKFDSDMAETAARHRATLVAMHIKGTPKTMQHNPVYENFLQEIKEYLSQSISAARAAGIEQIIIDPGIGFGKTTEHNLSLIHSLREFKEFGCPLLIGPSRKGFIGNVLKTEDGVPLPVDQRLEGTAAAVAISIINGANIVRVHDV